MATVQLVAYGAQDVYLTGDPKVTFFQASYKRYTNFAMETIRQTVNGTPGNGQMVSVTIGRMGDLVGDMFIQLTTTIELGHDTGNEPSTIWLAERAVATAELTIGGQSIEKHYQLWWRLYAEVFLCDSKKINYGKMTSTITNGGSMIVYLPLLFFFNRNPGLYLPMVALQYHDVRIDFTLTPYYTDYFDTGLTSFQVWANFVYLDTEERRRMAQKTHEYLIEQVQYNSDVPVLTTNSTPSVRLNISHPVKEFVWCFQKPGSDPSVMWQFAYSSNGAVPVISVLNQDIKLANQRATPVTASFFLEEGDGGLAFFSGPMDSMNLTLNGQPRFAEQRGKYFNQYQPYQYHSGSPYAGIYVYSFALKPEDHQPSGTCNFSRVDNAEFKVTLKPFMASAQPTLNLAIFAVGYNVLRIQGGMGGLAFSN